MVGYKKGHNWTDYDVAEQSDYYGNKIGHTVGKVTKVMDDQSRSLLHLHLF